MIRYDDTTQETAEYAAFIDKFKPKKTTDDCYTPTNVYEVVRDFAVRTYGLEGRDIIRPFYPGGDYENADYPDGCVVIDNPPFSILSRICAFYDKRGIDYFMFAPTLTLFSTNSGRSNYIVTDAKVTYENGATVNTSFVTNLGEFKIITAPELYRAIKSANDENTRPEKVPPKYEYPVHVISAATPKGLSKYGVSLSIRLEDTRFIRALDSQRAVGKAIYGGGFLLSDRAAAERAAAERAAEERAAEERAAEERATAIKWSLSDREKHFTTAREG